MAPDRHLPGQLALSTSLVVQRPSPMRGYLCWLVLALACSTPSAALVYGALRAPRQLRARAALPRLQAEGGGAARRTAPRRSRRRWCRRWARRPRLSRWRQVRWRRRRSSRRWTLTRGSRSWRRRCRTSLRRRRRSRCFRRRQVLGRLGHAEGRRPGRQVLQARVLEARVGGPAADGVADAEEGGADVRHLADGVRHRRRPRAAHRRARGDHGASAAARPAARALARAHRAHTAPPLSQVRSLLTGADFSISMDLLLKKSSLPYTR